MKRRGGTVVLITVLGVAIATTGMYDMLRHATTIEYEWMGACVTNLLLFFGGLTIVLFCRENIRMTTVTTMLLISVWGIVNSILKLDPSNTTLVMWSVSMLSLVLCVLLLYSATSIWLETSNGTMKGIIAIGILLLLIIIPMIYEIHKGTPIPIVFRDNVDQIPMAVMFIIVIVILTNKEMMLPSITSRITQNTIAITRSLSNEAEWYISPKELAIIKNNDMAHWKHIDDGSPVEYERRMVLFGMIGSELLLQRWKGDERIHLNVRPLFPDSSIANISITINHIAENVDEDGNTTRVRFYGTDGLFMDFVVKDPNVEQVGYIDSRKRNKKISDLNKYTEAVTGRIDRINDTVIDDLIK